MRSMIIITSSNGVKILLLLSGILFCPCLLCLVAQEAQPPSSPLPKLISFLDQRLVVAYPIIQTFKNTITSDPFNITQTWVGPNICNYTGFYCDNPPDNLTAIALSAVDFNGYRLSAPTLDGFIDQLPDLAFFHANSNNFSGTLSPKIANLRYFYELDISNNHFFGNFPASILTISTLTFLDIRFNSFSGSVPSQVFSQTIDVLFLNDNNFVQYLPPNLGSIPSHYLTLANNKFRGPIPRAIFNPSSSLTEILLLNNLLTGCIPYEIGFLTEVTVFDAGINLLTGPLPWSLGCLAKIELLNLAGNLLYGWVPEAVCGLGNLGNLSLSGNYFTGIGPLCWNLMKRGVLDVRKNCVPGLPNQRSVHECILFFMRPRYCPRHPAPFSYFPCTVPPRTEHPRIGT